MAGRLHGSICRDRDIARDGGGGMPRRGRSGLATRHSSEAYRYNWDPWRAAAEDDAAQIRQLRVELGPAAIAKRLGIARSSVYRALA